MRCARSTGVVEIADLIHKPERERLRAGGRGRRRNSPFERERLLQLFFSCAAARPVRTTP